MPEPISLMDLRRKTRIVQLNGGDESLQISGLTARQICDLLERFPALATLSIGGTLAPIDVLKAVPGAMAAWVASSCGYHNNNEAEAAADGNLTIEDSSFVIQETMDLTFSRGFGPFAGRVGTVMSYISIANPSRAPDMKSPSRSPPSVEELMAASGTSPRASSQPTPSSMNGAASPQAPPTSPMPPSEPEEKPMP